MTRIFWDVAQSGPTLLHANGKSNSKRFPAIFLSRDWRENFHNFCGWIVISFFYILKSSPDEYEDNIWVSSLRLKKAREKMMMVGGGAQFTLFVISCFACAWCDITMVTWLPGTDCTLIRRRKKVMGVRPLSCLIAFFFHTTSHFKLSQSLNSIGCFNHGCFKVESGAAWFGQTFSVTSTAWPLLLQSSSSSSSFKS